MLPEVLAVPLGLALTLVLPGAALSALLWPWRPVGAFAWARRALLSIVLSVAIVVLVSVPLVYGPWRLGGKGLFQGEATGAPVLEAALALPTLLFACGAWLRARRAPAPGADDAAELGAHARADALARGEAEEADVARDVYG